MEWAGVVRMRQKRNAHRCFGGENLSEEDSLEDVGVDGVIILKCLIEMEWNGVEWINLAYDRGINNGL